MPAMTGVAFWLGLCWRSMNVVGAWAAITAGFAAWLLATRGFFVKWVQALPLDETLRLTFTDSQGDVEIYFPW